MPNLSGLYLHIPFCKGKCAYCDFYSCGADDTAIDEYLVALMGETEKWGGLYDRPFDTVYIGGGTPSLLGGRIVPLMECVRKHFNISPDAEITAEMNPTSASREFLSASKTAGVNRLSIGVQSGIDRELKILGRKHTVNDAKRTVYNARELGFDNISLDLMLCLPESSNETLEKSISFLVNLNPEHISAYMLKIEDNTPLSYRTDLVYPDEDSQAEQYLFMSEYLKGAGYRHYEISNFARSGFESRHNLKYWRLKEYLGLGPSAHSFIEGKRFYYPRDLKDFIEKPKICDDGVGGGRDEEIMLALRLADGYDFSNYPDILPFLKKLSASGLGRLSGETFSLTSRGMAVSNSIITEILEKI